MGKDEYTTGLLVGTYAKRALGLAGDDLQKAARIYISPDMSIEDKLEYMAAEMHDARRRIIALYQELTGENPWYDDTLPF